MILVLGISTCVVTPTDVCELLRQVTLWTTHAIYGTELRTQAVVSFLAGNPMIWYGKQLVARVMYLPAIIAAQVPILPRAPTFSSPRSSPDHVVNRSLTPACA